MTFVDSHGPSLGTHRVGMAALSHLAHHELMGNHHHHMTGSSKHASRINHANLHVHSYHVTISNDQERHLQVHQLTADRTFKVNVFSPLALVTTVLQRQMDLVWQRPDQRMEEICSHSHHSSDYYHATSLFLEDHLVAGCVDGSGVTLVSTLLHQSHLHHVQSHHHSHHHNQPTRFTRRITRITIHLQCHTDQDRKTVPGLRSRATGVRSDDSKAHLFIWRHCTWFGTLGHAAL